ncbi:hypothetical protein FSARC_11947 [Fusarium sarcochroum]|uniref:Mannose-1-phosphate guanylyltransferase n=1 Tax=Fusarium sarcochroum TaxID=1208366 RepID=A0A8H4WYV2_9HYPO|nr:hypothetical protein FSARC_11947 [Fusarium sarcochroum]
MDTAPQTTDIYSPPVLTLSMNRAQDVACFALTYTVESRTLFQNKAESTLSSTRRDPNLRCKSKKFHPNNVQNLIESTFIENTSAAPTHAGSLTTYVLPSCPGSPAELGVPEAVPAFKNGRVGRDIVVDTPFECYYGHNIEIGDKLKIKGYCYINNVGIVKIGHNCVIGPLVKIYTEFVPTDDDANSDGQQLLAGKPVIIEKDCIIEAAIQREFFAVTLGEPHTIAHIRTSTGLMAPMRHQEERASGGQLCLSH